MFKVYKECCKECLLGDSPIVSNDRRKEILKGCAEKQTHFICHKASMEGEDICCKTFYDRMGQYSQMARMAQRLGMLKFVEQPNN